MGRLVDLTTLARHVWRVEGSRALRERLLERWEEALTLRRFERRDLTTTLGPLECFRTPVLHVTGHPPRPRFGGVSAQLATRLDHDRRNRPVAVLFPRDGRWWLEARADTRGVVADAGPWRPGGEGLAKALARAASAVDARAIQAESVAGLPLTALLDRGGLGLILSLHDFSLFCPRPHLLERPAGRFCDYCRDLARCARCLNQPPPPPSGHATDQGRRRELAATLLAEASAVVYPSEFLRRRHHELFPSVEATGGTTEELVPPPVAEGPPPSREDGAPERHHVAFLGGGHRHKGAAVFARLVRERPPGARPVTWSVYGGGGELLPELRELPGVTVRGHYRHGTLPRRLVADRVSVALLLSVVPETYSLTLSECRLARVPVIAFDGGALGERLEEAGPGIGHLVGGETGVEGVTKALGVMLSGAPRLAPPAGPWDAPGAALVAPRWAALHDGLGLAPY